MINEENKRRQQDEHVQYIKNHLCDKDGKKPFVFISYKSDDWETVLHEVVYTLVKDYGLNVYFDGSFDSHNSLWIEQFPENMESWYCKGVIAFLDDRYATSYATLMELMYSQTQLAGCGSKNPEKEGLPVVPVNLGNLTVLEGPIGTENTGLGAAYYPDKTKNNNAGEEQKLFNETFEELKCRGVLGNKQFLYKPGRGLTKHACSSLVSGLLAYLKVNENRYERGQSLDDIVSSIKDACGDDVFSELDEPVKPPVMDTGTKTRGQPVISVPPKPQGLQEKTISLPDFLKKYNNNTFKKDTFQRVRLAGQGEYAKYNSAFYLSTSRLVQDFVEGLLKERGEEYIHFVNGKNQDSKNPPFIPSAEKEQHSVSYRDIKLPGLESYAMCSNYSQFDWVNAVLCKRIKELGMRLEDFSLVYEDSTDPAPIPAKPETPVEAEEPEPSEEVTEGIIVLRDLSGKTHTTKKSTNAPDGYTFTLYGERHYEPKLKNLMLTVFKEAMSRHPDKLDQLVDKLACLSRDVEIHKDANPTTFRAGDYYIDKNDGRRIAIGTSMNQSQVLKSIGRLMQICGEPKENLDIVGYDY